MAGRKPRGKSKKRGRPSSFREEFVEQARKIALLGATEEEIADVFCVTVMTMRNWKKAHPEFFAALKGGKLPADSDVADRLHQRALGFEFEEAQPIKLKEVLYEDGRRVKETERIEIVMVHRVVPPDTTACIFWLKNRRPDLWRDRQPDAPPPDAAETARAIREALRESDRAEALVA